MLSDTQVEMFAIRAALGNNGGKWSTHYTNEQKDFWRRFVRDLESTIRAYDSGDIDAEESLCCEIRDAPRFE